MKKKERLYIVCLLISCLLLSNGFAQEYASQWHLPEGAKARLGGGKLNNIIFSPDSTRVAVSTPIGIWVYDVSTQEAVSLFAEIQTGEMEKFFRAKPPAALTFSADGVLIASAHGNSIYIWDTVTGAAFAMLDEHPDSITAIALSPDSTKLATAGEDWIVRLWDVRTGKYINNLIGHPGAINAVAFSPDGKILASAGSMLRLWNADTGELLHAGNKDLGSIDRLVFSPNGKVLAGGGGWDRAVHLWDVNTGTLQKSPKGHTGEIHDIVFSPDSATLASVGSDAMRLWDVDTGTALKSLPTPHDKIPQPVPPILKGKALQRAYLPTRRDDVHSVRFSQDATQLVSASRDGSLHIWDVATGLYQASFSLGAHSNLVSVLAFSEEGKYLASNDGFEARIRVWNIENATQHAILTPGQGDVFNPIRELTVSPGIKKLAGIDFQGTIQVWDATTLAQLSITPAGRMLLSWQWVFSPDGKILASRDMHGPHENKVELWQADPGVHLFTLEGHARTVTECTFSPDSKFLMSGSRDGIIILWDVKTGNRFGTLLGHTQPISALAFSADGKTLASGGGNEIRLWNVNTRNRIGNFDAAVRVDALAFSPDGKVIACGTEDGQIQIWNLMPNLQIQTTFSGHQGSIYVLMFSPDGKTLASGGSDGTILLWDM